MEAFIGLLILSLLVGVIVGALSGLLGIGGGAQLVPIFRLCFGMEPVVCTATSLFTIVFTSASGAFSHIRRKTCVPKVGVAAGIGGALTSPLGVWAAEASPGWVVMGAAALIIVYSAITMFRKALAAPKVSNQVQAARENHAENVAAAADLAYPALGLRELLVGGAIGVAAGFASGYVGVGGGFLMVPLMMSLLRIPMKLTSGTSLIAVMILAIPGVITQATLGNIDWFAGITVACGSVPGAMLGAKLIPLIPERTLRFVFGGILVLAAVLLVLNQTVILR